VRPKFDKPLERLYRVVFYIISFSDWSDYHTDTGWWAEKHNKDSYFVALSFLCISFITCLNPLKQILVNFALGGN